MTLIKYAPSLAFQQRLLERTGYSISNPHVRQPVRNPVAEKIKSIAPQKDTRAKLLLADRVHRMDRARQLGLAAITLCGGLLWNSDPSHAYISDEIGSQIATPPSLDPVKPDALQSFSNPILEQINGIDWSHPTFVPGLIFVLIIVQLLALAQRHMIARKLITTDQNVIGTSRRNVVDHTEQTDPECASATASEEQDNSSVDGSVVEFESPLVEISEPEGDRKTGEDQITASNLEQSVVDEAMPPEACDLPVIVHEPRKLTTQFWSLDAATRQGQVREENQDCFAVLEFAPELKAFNVNDGAGGLKGGREASHTATESISWSLRDAFQRNGDLTLRDLLDALDYARKVAAERDLTGVTTALVVLLKGDIVHYATLGDGAIVVIWPDGMVGHLQVPHHTAGQPSNIINAYIGKNCQAPARIGSCRLEPGSIVMTMTDGASDLFPYEDFALQREKIADMRGLADHLLAELESARDPDTGAYLHHDNMTLAMALLIDGDDHE
ncbi:protein phosphatase 2C domain-containing protein [Cohaesibacter gelatinilyticus]|uniref:Serine/threonine protein phosphatase PrpC n=1 Tax=Cohaesibacter gelatinilyticus TaxID=372072 RepID=A0A285PJP7_9HYPH|nr:protein phosphatase 2C domain-containing protein [Cohaesibacter gelatinilyticus]SNZ20101.1 Serine/threonine protein phosphatase PrpC [Cohaesibacter gelatinilyticus]